MNRGVVHAIIIDIAEDDSLDTDERSYYPFKLRLILFVEAMTAIFNVNSGLREGG